MAELAVLSLAAFLSGCASLAYQIAWTRSLASVTSATAIAQSIVLAIFMAGLGIGSLVAGRRAPRAQRPLAAYAAVEGAALLFAVVSPEVISASEAIRALGVWTQLALVSLFLLIPTTLLGASLPLLIEHLERRTDRSRIAGPRIVGILYAVNTLGAAAGCIASGFVSIERFGLSATVRLAALLALAAASIALAISRRSVPAAAEAQSSAEARVPRKILIAASLGGAIGLGAEVLWTRLIGLITPTTVYAYAQVLFAVLLGVAAGAWAAERLVKHAAREIDPSQRVLRFAGLGLLLAIVLLAVVPVAVADLATSRALLVDFARGHAIAPILIVSLGLVPPSAMIAAVLPLLVAAVGARSDSRSFGLLYAANTVGSVAGSLGMAFILLPLAGTHLSSVALEIIGLSLAIVLLGSSRKDLGFAGLAAITCAALELSHDVPRQIYEARMPEELRMLEFEEGLNSNVMVSEHRQTGQRRLWLNSEWVAGTGGTHRALGHLPALFLESPKRAVGIALGTGQTFAAVLDHGVEHLDCVEIDAGVIDLSRRWFREANRGLLDSPLVTVHVDDGRAFLRATSSRYDLVILEPLQAWSAGTSNLYSKEFYRDARAVLQPGGIVAQWIPFYGQGVIETKAMVRTGLEVFAHGSLWIDGDDAILLLSEKPPAVTLEDLDRRIRARGLSGGMAQLDLETALDLSTLLLMAGGDLAAWCSDAPVLEDDRPFLEFRAAHQLGGNFFPEILASTRDRLTAAEKLFTSTSSASREQLAIADAVRAAVLEYRLADKTDLVGRVERLERALPGALRSAAWTVHYREAILSLATSPLVESRGPEAVEAIYRRALRNAPSLGEVAINLALLLAQQGRTEEARSLLLQAKEIERTRRNAERLLERI